MTKTKMTKVFDIIPPEYKKREPCLRQVRRRRTIIYQRTSQTKKRKIRLSLLALIFSFLTMLSWPIMSSSDIYFHPNINMPKVSVLPQIKDIIKKIEINLRTQRLSIWESEKKIAEYIISTGKRRTPTKAGNFSVISKYPVAYGGIEGQTWTMPYFIGIYTAGGQENGIHELPYLNGWRESASSLGYPVSHGCVRLPISKAELVYNWAEIGTPVNIHY